MDALEAQRRRQLRLNQIEYERLSRKSSVAATAERPSVVEFHGPKVIKDEVEAYLADLGLTEIHQESTPGLAWQWNRIGRSASCRRRSTAVLPPWIGFR